MCRRVVGRLLMITLVLFASPVIASARGVAPTKVVSSSPAFVGTPGELVAFAMPRLIERMGMEVKSAPPALEASLQMRFISSQGWAWEHTLLRESGDFALSLTFPTDIERTRRGEVVIGVVEKGVLTRVLVFHLSRDSNKHVFSIEATTPEGDKMLDMEIPLSAGRLNISRSQLLALAAVLGPQTLTDGLFDGLIDFLEEILAILYDLQDLLNLAICACGETIEMLDDLNGCGWGNTQPGGGAVVNLLVCSVDATLEYIDELFGGCFGL